MNEDATCDQSQYYDWSVRFHPESRRKSCESVFKMDCTVKPGRRRGEDARHEGGMASERASEMVFADAALQRK